MGARVLPPRKAPLRSKRTPRGSCGGAVGRVIQVIAEDAIQTYHDLLTDELAGESQAQLDDQLRRRGLFFGDRPLCTVLRPRFLAPEQYQSLRTQTQTIVQAFTKAYEHALADEEFRGQFGLETWEEDLVRLTPGFRSPSPTARVDTFFESDGGHLWMTEYNAETPAAAAYNDVLTEVFLTLPIMREFLRHFTISPLPTRHHVLHALLDAYAQWDRSRVRPQIAILDWREVPTYSEFVLFAEYFASHGLACRIADPRELEYRGGRLWAGDFAITLIYKRVLLSELVERGGMNHPVIQAVRDGAACLVNSFRCKILHKKASLAVLSDERNSARFTASERQAIEAHVPWTRRVEERHTLFEGQRIDLIPFVLSHRAQLVLKANDAYGGKGIVLGWETTAAEWEHAVQHALSAPFVVQARVAVPRVPYPTVVDGTVQVIERLQDTNPYVFYGDYVDGCLTRLSTAALVNVTAGGGSTVPTVIVDRR